MAKEQQISTNFSPAGNRTPVSRVTGGDTHHYTTEETDGCLNTCLNFSLKLSHFSVVKNGQKQQQTTYFSTAGIWTPVSRVTGGDTHHYTTEETDGCLNSCLNFSFKLSNFLLLRMTKISNKLRISPRRGIEPRSRAWQAGILTTILSRKTHGCVRCF